MNPRTRAVVCWVVAVVVVAAVAGGGFLIIDQRAAGSGRALVPDEPDVTTSPVPTVSPTIVIPPRKHWLVAMVRRKTAVYEQPDPGSTVKMYLTPKSKKTGYIADTVCLVRKVKETPQRVWYNVWLPAKPNESRGWVVDRGVTLFPVYSKIVVDLSAHKLTVLSGAGEMLAQFPVGIGTSTNPTPTGRYFITAKIKLRNPAGPFGVFALATSAFSPTLTDWRDGGQVAIHGTDEPGSVGGSESHGCIRMLNDDVVKLVELVKTGSPVTIQP
jgi:lipoprotein-anchoring transpeptidase ErfK/SrfK